MDGRSRNEMLNLIPKLGKEEERELELRLGPPGEDYFSEHQKNNNESSSLISPISLGYYLLAQKTREELHGGESKKALSSPSQKRTCRAVGWPPIRSLRKSIASGSSCNSKQPPGPHQQLANNKGCLFVKINMDGVPIGRKVDINAFGSYHKLSFAVDNLFRDLLAAQRDSSSGGGIEKNKELEEENGIKCVLDGSGEYTLVYEDHQGRKNMLLGDVPWNMFVSTVKRLRVLKSSDLSAFSLGSKQHHMHHLQKAMK